jgi:uncharacterized protein (TIGR00730 family)
MSTDQRPSFNVAVFCGARPGRRPEYMQSATALGRALARTGIGIVCGGSRTGLMGALADACLEADGYIEGVLPEYLLAHEIAHTGLSRLVTAPDMHARKALMVDRADGIVALPGGFGTYDEFFEALSWAQLGIHCKPLWLLDVAGFFAPLHADLEHIVREGFASPGDGSLPVTCSTPDELVDELISFRERPPELRARLLEERRTWFASLATDELRRRDPG